MLTITDKKQLLSLMQSNAITITPNNRLSNELIHDFFKVGTERIQEKATCLPYQAFLKTLFKKFCLQYPLHSHPILLTTQQYQHLWRQVLTIHLKTASVNAGLLLTIEEAWTRCHLWNLNFQDFSFSFTPQTQFFQQVALHFQKELTRLNAITAEQLVPYLISHQSLLDATCTVNQERQLIWTCFDDYTPQQCTLQMHLREQGWQLYSYDLANKSAQIYQYAAQDEHDEYQRLIQWLKERLAHQEKRIGVVIPNLQEMSQHIKRLLYEQIPTDQFNISLGQTLLDCPLVAHALCWLKLDGRTLTARQAKLLLHSPYLGYSQREMVSRAQLMEESVFLREAQFEQSAFLNELKLSGSKLAELLNTITPYPDKASLNYWVKAFKSRLAQLGFPGEYPLNSENYQCYQRFLQLFDEFEQLALVTPILSQISALAAFKDLAKTTIFQAKSPSSATIHILGLLEASGCTFDSLWITGLTDQCLPQKPKLSAFIPITLQRDHLMPYASPLRELQLANKTLSRLQQSSPLCILSYPRFNDDKPNSPCTLICHFPVLQFTEKTVVHNPSQLIYFTESYQIPIKLEEKITGGSAVLANQAKCPFRAFAAHRLHAKTSPEISVGPDARERGQLLHKIMELLWRTFQNQQTLLTQPVQQINHQIEQAIQQALEPLIKQRPYSFSPLIQKVEQERLNCLIHACLEWERKRPPFKIEALEQVFTLRLADIDFQVRIDRLDQVDHNKKWVIDYKSSLPQSQPWNEERPQEPQLLLYALLDQTINTILFVQLKTGQIKCKGLSEESLLDGVTSLKKDELWNDYRQDWQTQLIELVQELKQGFCPPKPNNNSVCQQCDYQNLCRT